MKIRCFLMRLDNYLYATLQNKNMFKVNNNGGGTKREIYSKVDNIAEQGRCF